MGKITQRSYGGKSFRPTPGIQGSLDEKLVVSTSWGASTDSEEILKKFEELLAEPIDDEATMVRGAVSVASGREKDLVSVVQELNHEIFDSNRENCERAVELVVLKRDEGHLQWIQVGTPHLFLLTQGTLHPIGYTLEWNIASHLKYPLVRSGLGLEDMAEIKTGSFQVHPRDQLIMISRAQVPGALFSLSDFSEDSITRCLTVDNAEMPYWFAIFSF